MNHHVIHSQTRARRSAPRVFLTLVCLLLLIGGTGIGIRIAAKNYPDDIAKLLSDVSSWLDAPSDVGDNRADLHRQERRYQELHADLVAALDSRYLEDLFSTGRTQLRDQLALSIELAEEAFSAGDVDSALRLLENSTSEWQDAMAEFDAAALVLAEPEDLRTNFAEDDPRVQLIEPSDSTTDSAEVAMIDDEIPSLPQLPFDEQSFESAIPIELLQIERQSMDDSALHLQSLSEVDEAIANASEKIDFSDPAGNRVLESDSNSLFQYRQSPEVEATIATIPSKKSDEQPADTREPLSEETSVASLQPAHKIEISVGKISDSTGSKADDDTERLAKSQYESAVAKLDRELPSLRKNQAIVPRNDAIIDRVLQNRQKAVEAYQDREFGEAKRLIDIALVDAQTAAEQEREYYQLNLAIAKEAYTEENIETANEAIARAAALRPHSNEVAYWRNQIEVLPKFLQARRDAEVARSSGRLQDELDALERILLFSPNSGEAAQRIGEVRQQISNRKFTNTIDQGNQALFDGDLNRAKRALAQAKQQRPSASQTASLQNRIAEAKRQQEIIHHLTTAQNDAEQDNWAKALISYGRVLAIEPANKEAMQGYDFATQITALQRKTDEFLERPHRLSSQNIAAAARTVVQDTEMFSLFSAKLRSSTASLAQAVVKWQTPVPVRIKSDGETDIGIRGVGRIGKTEERAVELLPGTYVFEGKRKGYRTTLVEVVVKNDSYALTEVTVICSERS